jgi:peptidoglycan/LPS O-acetylase OafA/YrhL
MSSTNSRLIGLDVLRFAAASIVLITHSSNFGNAGMIINKISGVFGKIYFFLMPTGWVAVDIFFVLSGFLVSGLLFREAAQTGTVSIGRFLIRRGFKIYPAFWVMIACTVAWTLLHGGSVPLKQLLGELFYLQNYNGFRICWHTWSLAVEEHFYFLLAGLFLVLKWRARPNRMDFSVIPNVFLTVAVLCLIARFITWLLTLNISFQNFLWFIAADHAVLDSLFFGMMLSHFWHNCWNEAIKNRIIALRWLFALVGLGLLSPEVDQIMGDQWYDIFGFILVYLGAGCLLLSCLAIDYFHCPIFIKWLAWLGKYSYSVYLWHFFVGEHLYPHVEIKLDNMSGWVLNALILFICSWMFGILMASIIEFPALRCRDRWFPSLSHA